MELEFKKWQSIQKFSDAYAKAQKFGVSEIMYRPKIKLHGTNVGIHVHTDGLFAQKRSGMITINDDNAGFAKFVSELSADTEAFFDTVIIYGEWAGPGVQKDDAVCSIPEKHFFVFSALDVLSDTYIHEPEFIEPIVESIFGENYEDQNIFVIPWADEEYSVTMTDQNECQKFIDSVMQKVDSIGEKDPYIFEKFGVEGPGEGLVYYPISMGNVEEHYFSDYMFKAKTESHSVQKTKNRNHVAPEKPEGVDEFIEMFFTEQRFQQMLHEIGGKAERQKTGQFIKAVMSDVYKESEQEILISDFEWKDVAKYGPQVVKNWWFKECDKL